MVPRVHLSTCSLYFNVSFSFDFSFVMVNAILIIVLGHSNITGVKPDLSLTFKGVGVS